MEKHIFIQHISYSFFGENYVALKDAQQFIGILHEKMHIIMRLQPQQPQTKRVRPWCSFLFAGHVAAYFACCKVAIVPKI